MNVSRGRPPGAHPDALGVEASRFLAASRRAILATVDPTGRPRLVPICFALVSHPDGGQRIYTAVDDKPKRSRDTHRLGRIRDIAARPEVSVLIDRWDEDWRQLAWMRIRGRAEVIEPEFDGRLAERRAAISALRKKYPQYAKHDLEHRPMIAIAIEDVTQWGAV